MQNFFLKVLFHKSVNSQDIYGTFSKWYADIRATHTISNVLQV